MKKGVTSQLDTPSAKRGYKTFPCQVDGCGKAFTSSGLINHMRTHTGEKPFECVEQGCGKAFAEAGSLVKHTRIHTGEKPYKCTEPGCEQAFSLPRSLAHHILSHTGEKLFKCTEPGCSRAFTTSQSLVYHVRTHTGEKPFKCTEPDCSKAFTTSGDRVNHIRRIHTGEKPYKCTEPGCDKAFAASGNLLKHTRTHTGEKIYKCTEPGCEHAFTHSGSLVTHIRTHTGEKPFKCAEPGCLQAFTTSGSLVTHIRTHTGEKPYKCAEPGCDKTFATSGSLLKHTRTHTGEKPYKCTEPGCEQAFTQPGGLVSHMRTHTGEKPFKCAEPGCEQAFAQSGHLSSHTLTHTGEKSFKCTEPGCNQTFARPGSLVTHIRIHTGEKPFKCVEPGCNMTFAHYGSLADHTSRHYIPLLGALIADAFPSGRPIQCGLPMCVGPTYKLDTTGTVILPSIVQVSCFDQCGIRGFCCHGKKREYCGFPQCGGGERVCPICSTRGWGYASGYSYTIDGVRTCMTCFHTYFNARLGECTTTEQRLAILRKPSNRRIKEIRIAGDVVAAFGDRGWDFQGYTADCDDTLDDDEAELSGVTKGLGGFTRLKWYFTDMESMLGDGNTILVVEIDEHEHKQYPVSCEYNRMMGVVAAHRGKRVLFARFNPDEWNLNGDQMGSTFTKNANGIFEPNDLYEPRIDYFVQCVRELCSGSLLRLDDRDGLMGVMYVNYSTDSAAVAYSTEQLWSKNVCVKQMQ